MQWSRQRLNNHEETISSRHKWDSEDSIKTILHSDLSHPDFQHRNPVSTRSTSLVPHSRPSIWETGHTLSSPSWGRNYPLLPDKGLQSPIYYSLFSLQILSSSHSNKGILYILFVLIFHLFHSNPDSIFWPHSHHPPAHMNNISATLRLIIKTDNQGVAYWHGRN